MTLVDLGSAITLEAKESLERMKLALGRKRHFPSFINAYLEYTKNQESTKRIHKWVAISIIAAAMERKCFLEAGYFTIFPNLYIFVIGDSGVVRKSTSTGIGVDLLREIDSMKIMSERVTAGSLIAQLERSGQEFTINGHVKKQSAVFAYASELVVFLNEVFGSISELLTTFYDGGPKNAEKPWIYETKGEGQVKVFGPCLNILGASTASWLQRAIPVTEMEGGFSSRVIFVVERGKPDRLVAWPELDPILHALKPKLLQDLEQIHSLRGNFKKTEAAHKFYEEWYINFKNKNPESIDPRFRGYFGRKPTTILKVAMVLSVAESNDMILDEQHIAGAIEALEDLESSMFDAFGSAGKNELADGLVKVRALFEAKDVVTHQEIMQSLWRDFNGAQLMQIIGDLQRMGEIEVVRIAGNNITYRARKRVIAEA